MCWCCSNWTPEHAASGPERPHGAGPEPERRSTAAGAATDGLALLHLALQTPAAGVVPAHRARSAAGTTPMRRALLSGRQSAAVDCSGTPVIAAGARSGSWAGNGERSSHRPPGEPPRAAAAPATVGLGLLGLTLPGVSATAAAWFRTASGQTAGQPEPGAGECHSRQHAGQPDQETVAGRDRPSSLPTFNHGDPPAGRCYEDTESRWPERTRALAREVEGRRRGQKPELAPSRPTCSGWWPNAPGAGRHPRWHWAATPASSC